MAGMETLRCPTCVTLLMDPEARRCPACHTKLRKRRRRPIVLGESNRLSGRSLPFDTELRVRAEARNEPFEPFVSKAKRHAEPLEATLAFAPSESIAPPEPEVAPEPVVIEPATIVAPAIEPAVAELPVIELPVVEVPVVAATAPEPIAEPEPLPYRKPEPVIAADAPLPELPIPALLLIDHDDLPELSVPEPAPLEAHFLDPALAPPKPALEMIDLTAPEPLAETIDLSDEPEPAPVRGVRPNSRWQAVPARGVTPSPLDGTLNDMVEELHRKAREDVGPHRST